MTTNPSPQEHPATYIVHDRFKEEEVQRLSIQDKLATDCMGGVLPEQENPAAFTSVLDVACGTGGWLIEVAKTYPTMTRLTGVDASKREIEYARAQAKTQGVSDRVEFYVMDVLQMLEFPDRSFDLVNQRFGVGWLRTWDWPRLLSEYQRVCRPGGTIRIVEGNVHAQTNSPALDQLFSLLTTALFQAEHMFTPQSDGVTAELPRLFSQQRLERVQARISTFEYRAGTQGRDIFAEDMISVFRTIVPFFQKWNALPADYNTIYQQAVKEMQQPTFAGSDDITTIWGICPLNAGRS